MKPVLNLVLYTGAAIIILSLWGFYSAIRPFRIITELTPSTYHIPFEHISFTTNDKVLIRGWFIKNANPKAKTIILMHGYPSDKGDILPATIFLHNTYNLLYFDFRYLGESEGHYSTIGQHEILDLLAAIQFLHTRNINEVGVWGFSLGAAVALMTASSAPEIKAIVAESSYARLDWMTREYYSIPLLNYVLGELTRWWGWLFLGIDVKQVSPAAVAEKLKTPVLLIYSKLDTIVPIEHGLLLEQALRQNNNAEVIVNDNVQHGQHLIDNDKIILQFFKRYL